jgi:hypothetical protein
MVGAAGPVVAVDLNSFDLAAFVAASCERSGVPVKVSDALVRQRVALLLSGRAVRGDAPASRGPSDPPDQVDPVRIEDRTSFVSTGDHSVVQDRFDDGVLPGEVEVRPLSA